MDRIKKKLFGKEDTGKNNNQKNDGAMLHVCDIKTDLLLVHGLETLKDNTVAVTGESAGKHTVLRKYSIQGELYCQKDILGTPTGLSEIIFRGSTCLAVSYQKNNRIDFHDRETLQEIVGSITRPEPGVLCAISPNVLAYVQKNGNIRTVEILDCSREGGNVIQSIKLDQSMVWGLSLHGGQLHVAGHGKVCAYDILNGGKVAWQLYGELKSKHPEINPQDISINLRSNTLSVACMEGYIYEITTDGKYIKTLFSKNHGTDQVCHLVWCKTATHLIVHGQRDKKSVIHVFRYPNEYSRDVLQKAFKKACSGQKETFRVRLATIGTSGVGKTSLVHNLLGQPFVERHISTQGIATQTAECDNSLDVREGSTAGGGDWEEIHRLSVEITEDDICKEVIEYIRCLEERKTPHQDPNPNEDQIPRTARTSTAGANRTEHIPSNEEENGDPGPSEEILKTIQDELRVQSTTSTRFGKKFRITIWDFGGQLQFYATHHMFLDCGLVYMLVLDMTKDLDSIVETKHEGRLGSKGIGIPKTVREFIDYWLNTIHCYAQTTDNSVSNSAATSSHLLPPVIVVLTHKDLITPQNMEQYVTKYVTDLMKHIDDKPYEHHVVKIIPVDNKNRNIEETEGLRETILKLAGETPGWGKARPIKWLQLENAIHVEADYQQQPYITISEVEELADSYKIGSQELGEFIKFHRAIGDILYFHGTDKVIAKPQWLIDSFSKVITAPEFYTTPGLALFKKQVKKLDAEGIVSLDLLCHFWGNDINFLLNLMIKFRLMIPVGTRHQNGESSFYIPCMLPDVNMEEFDKMLGDNPDLTKLGPGLFYTPKGRFLPIGFFQNVVCYCSSIQDWSIHTTVSYNAVVFRVTSINDLLVSLTSREFGIKLEVWSLTPIEKKPQADLPQLKRNFEECLEKLGEFLEFSARISPCEKSIKIEAVCLLPIAGFEKDYGSKRIGAVCPKHLKSYRPDEYMVWLQDSCIEETTEEDDHKILWQFSGKITNENKLFDVGLGLGVIYDAITQIRFDNRQDIRSAGFALLCHWQETVRDRSEGGSLPDLLNSVFYPRQTVQKGRRDTSGTFSHPRKTKDSSKINLDSDGTTAVNQSNESSCSSFKNSETVERQDHVNFLREVSKRITDEVMARAIGVDLGLSDQEISIIFTDHHNSIEIASFHILYRWYEKYNPRCLEETLRETFLNNGLPFKF